VAWDRFRVLIAQLLHYHYPMRRHSNGHPAHNDAKPFTDFLAERQVMGAADLNVTLVRGAGHDRIR